jgi:hypothetical protein
MFHLADEQARSFTTLISKRFDAASGEGCDRPQQIAQSLGGRSIKLYVRAFGDLC